MSEKYEKYETSETPDIQELLGLFPEPDLRPESVERVQPEEVPEPYRSLLVHEHHMTVTLERHHGTEVDLVVRDRKWVDNLYCRRLLLTAGEEAKVVLVGIIRFHMSRCSETVRQQVEAEKTPLGKILMEHCSLRRIQPHAYLRVALDGELRRLFGSSPDDRHAYGRTAIITCHHRPVVELLEVVFAEEVRASADGKASQTQKELPASFPRGV